MLTPYDGPFDRPVWYLRVGGQDYVLLPAKDRPGGPVVFTSPTAARKFLRYHAERWEPLRPPQIVPAPWSLGEIAVRFRRGVWSQIRRPDYFLFIDPAPPIHPMDDLDGWMLPMTPLSP